ncbi:MAG: GNAT family N-acetyltransferase [Bacteroidetes bacterium]|nr:GNAT family N-acetyltransferase [Bacteroidota bacterium]
MFYSDPLVKEGFLFEESGFTAQLCNSDESLKTAYRLRYKAYRSVNGIPENPAEMAKDKYDLQPNARTHLIWYEDQPVASVRSMIRSGAYSGQSTTCVDAYRSEIDKEFGPATPLLESNRYVVDPEFKGRKSLTAQYLLFRIQTISCLYDRCQFVITAVRSNHVSFYKRLMGFYPISKPRIVPGFQFETVLLATPYSNRMILAKNASAATSTLEDYERYVRQAAALELV